MTGNRQENKGKSWNGIINNAAALGLLFGQIKTLPNNFSLNQVPDRSPVGQTLRVRSRPEPRVSRNHNNKKVQVSPTIRPTISQNPRPQRLFPNGKRPDRIGGKHPRSSVPGKGISIPKDQLVKAASPNRINQSHTSPNLNSPRRPRELRSLNETNTVNSFTELFHRLGLDSEAQTLTEMLNYTPTSLFSIQAYALQILHTNTAQKALAETIINSDGQDLNAIAQSRFSELPVISNLLKLSRLDQDGISALELLTENISQLSADHGFKFNNNFIDYFNNNLKEFFDSLNDLLPTGFIGLNAAVALAFIKKRFPNIVKQIKSNKDIDPKLLAKLIAVNLFIAFLLLSCLPVSDANNTPTVTPHQSTIETLSTPDNILLNQISDARDQIINIASSIGSNIIYSTDQTLSDGERQVLNEFKSAQENYLAINEHKIGSDDISLADTQVIDAQLTNNQTGAPESVEFAFSTLNLSRDGIQTGNALTFQYRDNLGQIINCALTYSNQETFNGDVIKTFIAIPAITDSGSNPLPSFAIKFVYDNAEDSSPKAIYMIRPEQNGEQTIIILQGSSYQDQQNLNEITGINVAAKILISTPASPIGTTAPLPTEVPAAPADTPTTMPTEQPPMLPAQLNNQKVELIQAEDGTSQIRVLVDPNKFEGDPIIAEYVDGRWVSKNFILIRKPEYIEEIFNNPNVWQEKIYTFLDGEITSYPVVYQNPETKQYVSTADTGEELVQAYAVSPEIIGLSSEVDPLTGLSTLKFILLLKNKVLNIAPAALSYQPDKHTSEGVQEYANSLTLEQLTAFIHMVDGSTPYNRIDKVAYMVSYAFTDQLDAFVEQKKSVDPGVICYFLGGYRETGYLQQQIDFCTGQIYNPGRQIKSGEAIKSDMDPYLSYPQEGQIFDPSWLFNLPLFQTEKFWTQIGFIDW